MKKAKIGFLGGGNIAKSLIAGLIKDGTDPTTLLVADRHPEKLADLSAHYGVHIFNNLLDVTERANILILAVKPINFESLCRDIRPTLHQLSTSTNHHSRPLIISLATGIKILDMSTWLGAKLPIIRAMPNTPSMLQAGATALFANEETSSSEREMAEKIMRSVGVTAWLPKEEDIESIIAIAGSAPAYYFRIMELIQEIGEEMGIAPDVAKLFITQTLFGSGKMALESPRSLADLRAQVTSKGGTTQAALQALEGGGLKALLHKALHAAKHRGIEIGEEYGVNRKLK
jgi:pyrroline-5-carboxylate reductase